MANPLAAIAQAVTSQGTDPNTGAVLRDRFHQIRGNPIATRDDTMLGKLAQEFLASRGAPVTPQNLVTAQEYLRGGGLGMLEQQQATEDDIANAAIAAEAGAGAGGGGGPVTAAPPMQRPDAPPDIVTSAPQQPAPPDSGPGGVPFIPPVIAPARAMPDGRPIVQSTDVVPNTAINGQVLAPDEQGNVRIPGPNGTMRMVPAPMAAAEGWTVVGVNADAGNQIEGGAPRMRLGYTPDLGVEDAEVINEPRAPVDDAATRAIDTEEVMAPQQNRKVGDGSVNIEGKPVGYSIYQTPEGTYSGVLDDGRIVTDKSADLVRRALRGLR